MADSFYWYDLETSGTNPKWDRIVQFAGLRTDADLNPLNEGYCTYVQLADDVLPNPQASLVTSITPQLTHKEGISETQALLNINRLFCVPNTCVAGYNSLRFDDEFMRYGLYRNLLDPYAREWQQGNSRWDLIDLVRATGALRRDGIHWPRDDQGLPVYKLEALTQANGIAHGNAHDALSDVYATVGLARLIKKNQPKLFEYYFSLRRKKAVRELLEPYGARICVHVSALYPRERFGVGPVMSITPHPSNANSIVVVDLAEDVEPLLAMNAEEIAQKLFTADASERPPLKEIRINRCPFIAPIEVLNEENLARIPIDLKAVKARARRIRQPGFAQKVARAYRQRENIKSADPDAGLYDGFLQEEDRSRNQFLHSEIAQGRWPEVDFSDSRLVMLAQRMKARSFAGQLNAQEAASWRTFVAEKLTTEGEWMSLTQFESAIKKMRGDQPADSREGLLLDQLAAHALEVRRRYQL